MLGPYTSSRLVECLLPKYFINLSPPSTSEQLLLKGHHHSPGLGNLGASKLATQLLGWPPFCFIPSSQSDSSKVGLWLSGPSLEHVPEPPSPTAKIQVLPWGSGPSMPDAACCVPPICFSCHTSLATTLCLILTPTCRTQELAGSCPHHVASQ